MMQANRVKQLVRIRRVLVWTLCVCWMIGLGSSARAESIYSQTKTGPVSGEGGTASDRDALSKGTQMADDLTLAQTHTARSVTFWGMFGPFTSNNTPVTPVSFDLIIYADSGSLPDVNNIVSSTPVVFNSLTDTGTDVNGLDLYEFKANLTPTVLNAGTKYWFSVLADTSNDLDDDFLWWEISGGNSAYRSDVAGNGAFGTYANVRPLFILDNAAIPEPGSLALLGLGGLMLLKRRRD